jgi:hypothetical protein
VKKKEKFQNCRYFSTSGEWQSKEKKKMREKTKSGNLINFFVVKLSLLWLDF